MQIADYSILIYLIAFFMVSTFYFLASVMFLLEIDNIVINIHRMDFFSDFLRHKNINWNY